MRQFGLSSAFLLVIVSPIMAAPGDQWILGIHHVDQQPLFTKYTGAGYSGPQSSGSMEYVGHAYGRSGAHGQARIYWELSGNAIESGRPVPTSAQLYSLEFFGTTEFGHNGWQPVESQFRGVAGEMFPHEPLIPWSGAFGTNHQWIGSDGKDNGEWNALDNNGQGGPQAPFDENMDTPPDGIYMWLRRGSWLYAKWDFTFPIDRSWSALRLTQITGPEPLEGDYNNDDQVDAADYVAWRKSDINGENGYDVWLTNFGRSNDAPSTVLNAASAVPEPSSAIAFAMGLIGVCWLGRRPREYFAARFVPRRNQK
jgi:hypothetical protein